MPTRVEADFGRGRQASMQAAAQPGLFRLPRRCAVWLRGTPGSDRARALLEGEPCYAEAYQVHALEVSPLCTV